MKEREKNENTFLKLHGQSFNKDDLNDKSKSALFVTPRVVSKEGHFKGMSA